MDEVPTSLAGWVFGFLMAMIAIIKYIRPDLMKFLDRRSEEIKEDRSRYHRSLENRVIKMETRINTLESEVEVLLERNYTSRLKATQETLPLIIWAAKAYSILRENNPHYTPPPEPDFGDVHFKS